MGGHQRKSLKNTQVHFLLITILFLMSMLLIRDAECLFGIMVDGKKGGKREIGKMAGKEFVLNTLRKKLDKSHWKEKMLLVTEENVSIFIILSLGCELLEEVFVKLKRVRYIAI